jgi:hypothetical protein
MKDLTQQILYSFSDRCHLALNNNGAEPDISDTVIERVLDQTTEVIVGSTAYRVSSFFKKDAKVTVADKISRLIERDIMLTEENETTSKTTGISGR